MSTIKKENKDIYDGIKLNTESRERIIEELVEKIESNSNRNNVLEFDKIKNEKNKNNKVAKTVKTTIVAMASLAATLAIVIGVTNHNKINSNNKVVGVNKETESVSLKETEKKTDALSGETEKITEKEKESKINLDNAKVAPDFKLVNEPHEKNGKWDGQPFEYEYAKSDIDGDGKKDVVKLSYETSKKYEGTVTGKVTLLVNDVEKKTYKLGAGQNPRNVKFLKMDNNNFFVYFNIGELTTLCAWRVVNLQDYEEVLSDVKMPCMARVENIMVNNKDKKLIFDYVSQLKFIGATELLFEISYADGVFNIDNKWIEAVEGNPANEFLQEYDGKYVLKEDVEFNDGDSDTVNKYTVKKGEKLTLKSVRWSDSLAGKEDLYVEALNYWIDMYHFTTEDGKDVYLNPLEGDGQVGDVNISLFEGIFFAQ